MSTNEVGTHKPDNTKDDFVKFVCGMIQSPAGMFRERYPE